MKRYNVLFGGPAGTGPNFLTHLLGETLVSLGYNVFYSRDYQSLIRGGHNFNQLTFSKEPVFSNDSKIDILVCLDEKTERIHKKDLNKSGIILKNHSENSYYAGELFKLLGIDFKRLDFYLKRKKDYKNNIKFAKQGYKEENRNLNIIKKSKSLDFFKNGNQGISQGAIKSGLYSYFAYPMTPATPILSELAKANKNYVIELENEIAVANAGVGCAMTGALAMVGTSGGGFDLMSETLSLTGMAEVPLVFYLSQRPGPATGIATYSGQGDLNIARHAGHGEFPRVVLAPGDALEAEELTNQAFYLSQKFHTPGIIIGDKHLAESFYSYNQKPKLVSIPKKTSLKRYNSYEKDSVGSATEDPDIINKNIEKRKKKYLDIEKDSKRFSRYSVYGKKNSKNVVVSWGSTKGAILDAIRDLNTQGGHKNLQAGCKFVQIKYIEPFPKEIKKELKGNLILVENNATGELANLVREKTGIEIKKKILRYDGRPFLCDELNREIRRKIK